MIDISTKLKDLRIKAGLSQEKLAEQLIVSRQAVSKWENGEALPDMENMVALARLYNISLDELVGINTDKNGAAESKNEDASADAAFETAETIIEDGTDEKKSGVTGFLYSLPYPIIATIAFFLLGSLADAWHIAWILFVTIPVYYSLISCISARRFAPFAYPVLATCIYLFIGMQFSLWHPGWVIFLTIPVYYPIASAIDRAIANRKNPDFEN